MKSFNDIKTLCLDMVSDRTKEPLELTKEFFYEYCCDDKGFFNDSWRVFAGKHNLIAKFKHNDSGTIGIFINDKLNFY